MQLLRNFISCRKINININNNLQFFLSGKRTYANATVDANSGKKAKLVEIFSCIQGEGLHVGMRQLFVRFSVCDLRCRFCDTSHTWKPAKNVMIEQTTGKRDFVEKSNPIEVDTLISYLKPHLTGNNNNLHKFLALTGGEPLLHSNFLTSFLPVFRHSYPNVKVYLETAGHLPERLQPSLVKLIDSYGMDFKLPSVSGEKLWKKHEEFLKIIHNVTPPKEIFIKIIISAGTDVKDLHTAANIIRNVDANIVVFLQPVTKLTVVLPEKEIIRNIPEDVGEISKKNFDNPPTPQQVLDWQHLMMTEYGLNDVRVVPQTHKMLNQL